ncbi:colicin D domain-containing protein [Aphanothece sacrum]|uniref:Colicin D-like protein n=1 Tax=Aphanothece sacrum FPU1 TaxID=1920663 RepID=A0A401ILR7_APHSA|nr:colicin D domain-containing protein [Aphanothece sacrum]GBF82203.1 colicin D-like protein [Aphanothece sacrum FPU1]GBF87259.1 hypothetical protein AsFPU3_4341 [Aphanothece sacrum FPU3]
MVRFDSRQIQAKFKHAGDFDIIGNFNLINATKFKAALQAHIDEPTTQKILGTYRGVTVIHKFNPNTKINVILDLQDNFISGRKLNPDQIALLMTKQSLGGG